MKKAFRLTALVVAFSVMQVYVLADAVRPGATTGAAAESKAPAGLLLGRLTTTGEPIRINGNSANSGYTVISGAQLQTPANAGATVQIASLGRVEISPGTDLSLSFDKSGVNVNVARGSAFLTTLEGVKGTLTTPEGKTRSAESAAALGVEAAPPAPKMTPKEKHTLIGVFV
ncbi:MAG TPA: hypothetical protein VF507_03690, partial [Pyrinomonadaceae bacterium]